MPSAKKKSKQRALLIQKIKDQKAAKNKGRKRGEPVPPGGGKNSWDKSSKKSTGR